MSELSSAGSIGAQKTADAPEVTPAKAPLARVERQSAVKQIHRSLRAWRSEGEASDKETGKDKAPEAEEVSTAQGSETPEAESTEEPIEKKVAAKHKGGGIKRKIFRYGSEFEQYNQYAREQDPNYAMEQDKPAAEEISTQIMALQSPPDLASLLKFDALKKDARWPQVSESCKSLEPVKQAKTKLAEVTQQYNEAGVAAMSELITAVQAIQPPAANAPPGGKSPQDQISDLKQQDRYRLWLNATVLAALPQAAAKVTEAKGAITAKEAELAAAQTNATNAAGGGAPDPAASQRDLLERQKKDIINVLEGMAAQIQVEAMQIDVAASGIATGLGLLAATGVAAPLAAVLAGLGAGALGLLQSRKSRKVGAELKVLVEQVKEASDAAAIGAIFEQLRTELESFEVFKAELGAKLGAARPAQPANMGAAEKVEHGAHGAHVIVEGVSVASHAVHHLTESFMPGLGVLILAYKTILHSSHFEHLEHEIHEKKEVEERLRAGGEAGGGAGGDHGGGGGGGH